MVNRRDTALPVGRRRAGLIIAMLCAILLLAAFLRLWKLDASSFTYDAAALSNLAAQFVDTGQVPLQGMVSSTGIRNPALGVYLISLPVLFSRDPVVLAGFVALLNIAALFGTFWLGRRYWGPGVGLLAALLFAVSPWAVQHSRGILGQDLLIPGVVLFSVFLFAWFVDGKPWALAASLVTAFALLQIHLAALAFFPLLAVLLAWQIVGHLRYGERMPAWKPLLAGVALGTALYIPYVVAEIQSGWPNLEGFGEITRLPYRLYAQAPGLLLMNIGGRNIHALAGAQAAEEYLASLVDPAYRLDRLEELLFVLAALYLAARLVQRRSNRYVLRRDALLLLWIAVPLVFFMVAKSEAHLHYLVVTYPAPYLTMAAAAQDLLARSGGHPWRKALALVGAALVTMLVLWQAYLATSIYRFLDLNETPGAWGTPVRILREVVRTTGQLASLNESTQVVMLCPGSEPRWDDCPAAFSFLTSRGPELSFVDFDDPKFRVYQDDPETLMILAPGDSLAAAELPHLAQALPDADVVLREGQGAFRFFRLHNPYRRIAGYLTSQGRPGDAVVLVGPGQRADLARFYQGPLPIYELPVQPVDREATAQQLSRLAAQHRRLYVLYRASEESDPAAVIEGWLRTHTYAGADQWLGQVRVVPYDTPGATATWLVQDEDASFGDELLLSQVALSGHTLESGDMLRLQLAWEALGTPLADYALFVQLVDEDGQVRMQRDIPLSGDGQLTSTWQDGQQVTTLAGMVIPAGTPPGSYSLLLGLYDPASGRRLAAGEAGYLDLGPVTIMPPVEPGVTGLSTTRFQPNIVFPGLTLVGFDRYKSGFAYAPDTPVTPGDTLQLIFEWQANEAPAVDWLHTVRLVDRSGKSAVSAVAPLAGDRYPTTQWRAGEMVRGEHSLALPSTLAPGRYDLQLGVHEPGESGPGQWVDLGPLVVR